MAKTRPMGISKNGASQAPAAAMVTTSWMHDDFGSRRHRFKGYAAHVPLMQAVAADMQLGVSHPRIASAPTLIGEVSIEVPNLEVAKILHTAPGRYCPNSRPRFCR